MAEDNCSEYERLEAEAHAVLKKLGDIAAAQTQALDDHDPAEFARLDQELELTVGHKERIIGALREHALIHGCKPPFLQEL